jgi:hypothetical protein
MPIAILNRSALRADFAVPICSQMQLFWRLADHCQGATCILAILLLCLQIASASPFFGCGILNESGSIALAYRTRFILYADFHQMFLFWSLIIH